MPVYLISKAADPVFAVSIGIAAVLSRVRRDQREKHPERAADIGYGEILQTGGRRLQRWWAGDFQGL